ncbi:hypothetical protein MKX01_002652 [Papaver californicum]|nr:hypothetical protein MKX01_002652 [Papaver californicum]
MSAAGKPKSNASVSCRKNAKKQQQNLYYENENKRPLNPANLNVLTSHTTSKTSNNKKTKKKKPPSEEPACITAEACHSSDSDVVSVDSEDNGGLCLPETKSEKVSKGPARFELLTFLTGHKQEQEQRYATAERQDK